MIWRPKSYDMRFRIGRLSYYIPGERPDPSAIGDGTPEYSDEAVFVSDVREYNNRGTGSRGLTAFGATTPYGRYKKKLTDHGETAIEQVGVLLWMNSEEAIAKIDEIVAEGWWMQQ